MIKETEARMLTDINNVVDAMLYECLIDIPDACRGYHNAYHKKIVDHIITRIQNTHERYYDDDDEDDYDA